MFFGIILLIFGVAFLLKNLGVMEDVTWSIIWPSILILFGLIAIFRKKRKIWE